MLLLSFLLSFRVPSQVMTQLVRTNPHTYLLSPELVQWEVDTYFKIRKDMHRLGVRALLSRRTNRTQ